MDGIGGSLVIIRDPPLPLLLPRLVPALAAVYVDYVCDVDVDEVAVLVPPLL